MECEPPGRDIEQPNFGLLSNLTGEDLSSSVILYRLTRLFPTIKIQVSGNIFLSEQFLCQQVKFV